MRGRSWGHRATISDSVSSEVGARSEFSTGGVKAGNIREFMVIGDEGAMVGARASIGGIRQRAETGDLFDALPSRGARCHSGVLVCASPVTSVVSASGRTIDTDTTTQAEQARFASAPT